MKKNIQLLLFLGCSQLAFSQQGILDSNFGIGQFNYVENENDKELLTAIEYTNDTLFAAGYAGSGANITSPNVDGRFAYKDRFFYYNGKTHNKAFISIGDEGSRANAIKHYGAYVYLAGYSKDKNNKSISVVKILAKDAKMDVSQTFNGDGKVVTDFTDDDEANAIDIKNNKIWVAGRAGDRSVIVRYNLANGYVDKTFNQKGFMFYPMGTKSEIKTLKILSDDKVLIAGTANNAGQTDFFIARLNPDGTYDSSFGTNGIKTIDFFGQNDQLNIMKILYNGKIMLGGSCTKTATNIDAALVRLNADGSYDTSFGGTGKVTYDEGTKEDVINDVDAKVNASNYEIIYAIGYKKPGLYKDVLYREFDADGSTFANGPAVGNQSYYDDYVIGGAFNVLPPGNFTSPMTMYGNWFCREATGRYTQFNKLGVSPESTAADCGSSYATEIKNIKVRQDGKIYVLHQNQLKRYLSDGTPDLSFGTKGTFTGMATSEFDLLPNNKIVANVLIYGTSSQAYSIILDDNGKIIDNFEFKNLPGADQRYINKIIYSAAKNKMYAYYSSFGTQFSTPVMCRYNLDGTIDGSFANNNKYIPVVSQYGSGDADLNRVDVNNQRIVTLDFTTDKKVIKQYDLDGNPVASFGNMGTMEIASPNPAPLFKKVILDNLNNIYIINEKNIDFNTTLIVEKYNSTGMLDTSYGNSGIFEYAYNSASSDVKFYTVTVQSDNKLLIAGKRSKLYVFDDGYIVRVNSNGTLDTSFSIQNDGVFSDMEDNNPSDYFEIISAMGITPNNEIIIGGLNKNRNAANALMDTAKIKRLK
ncbi:delta-60 repeat domain-containing protein [Chryseobacterium tructae]|uniref:Delta-60 repeat domain-containing protein n=1 Tax=Chryseobacterium tructae TaxID=1037380 RepID=A0ABV7XSG7_9FLAO|nr:delta-60 repeat domain-containing protein [Chryseobacterium tructae]MDN3690805.1 delta-60 repeat domain-containing protein [Chryseobacterium tructae]